MPTLPSKRPASQIARLGWRRGSFRYVLATLAALLAVLLLVLGIASFGAKPAESVDAPLAVSKSASPKASNVQNPLASAASAPRPTFAPKAEPDEASTLPLGAPSLSTVREEARANPHAAAPSLLAFATRVSREEQSAESNPAALAPLASELSACALSNAARMPQTARIFCAQRLERLAARHPAETESIHTLTLSRMPAALAAQTARKGFQ